jgi:hypothetical protein
VHRRSVGRLSAAFSQAAVLAARPSSALAGAAVELASSWARRFMKDAHEFGGVPAAGHGVSNLKLTLRGGPGGRGGRGAERSTHGQGQGRAHWHLRLVRRRATLNLKLPVALSPTC